MAPARAASGGGDGRSPGQVAVDYGTQTDASESVSIAMLITFLALLTAGGMFGKARDWVKQVTGG